MSLTNPNELLFNITPTFISEHHHFPGFGDNSHPHLASFPRCCALLNFGDSWVKPLERPPVGLTVLRAEALAAQNATQLAVSFEHNYGCAFTYFHAILNAALPLFELLRVLQLVKLESRQGQPARQKKETFADVFIYPLGGALQTWLPGLLQPGLRVHWADWVPQCCTDVGRWCSPPAAVPPKARLILPVRLDTNIFHCCYPCRNRGSMTWRARFLFTGLRNYAHRMHGLLERPHDFSSWSGSVILIERGVGTLPSVDIEGLSASGAQRRSITNREQLVEAMDATIKALRWEGLPIFDFSVIAFEQLSFYKQLQALQSAAVLVGLHGAGLSNCAWLPDKAAIVELSPKGYSLHCFQWLCGECLHLVYHSSDSMRIVFKGACDNGITFCGGVEVDIVAFSDELATFLKRFWQVMEDWPWRKVKEETIM